MESNDSPEIPEREATSDIPGLPSGEKKKEKKKKKHKCEQENVRCVLHGS